MKKKIYVTPDVKNISFCNDSVILSTSSDTLLNPYYSLDYDDEDDEFSN